MLKIKRFADGEFAVFVLSGRIGDEHLEQLENLFKEERQRIILDLKEVNLAGCESITLLARWEERGAKLKDCPPFIREWINRKRDKT